MSKILYFGRACALLAHSTCAIAVNLCVACSSDKESPADDGYPRPWRPGVLSGTITYENSWWSTASAFRVQLIEGTVSSNSLSAANYQWPRGDVFVTQADNKFLFEDIQEGEYTICITKRGFEPIVEHSRIFSGANSRSFYIETDPWSGFTGEVQALGEDGDEIRELKFRRYTPSVFFYLFNGTSSPQPCRVSDAIPNYGDLLYQNYIIDGEVVGRFSTWTKEVKVSSSTIAPNGIALVEVVIDPFLYQIREHSSCTIWINSTIQLTLSY